MYLSGIQHHTLTLCFGQNYHLFTHGWPFDGEFEPVEVIAGQTLAKVNVTCLFPRLNTSVSLYLSLGLALVVHPGLERCKLVSPRFWFG